MTSSFQTGFLRDDDSRALVVSGLVGGGAFPSVATVLDNFNRADETPVAAPWDGGITSPSAALRLVSNELRSSGGGSLENARMDGPFGPDVESQIQYVGGLVNGGAILLYARVTDAGTAGWDGYVLNVTKGAPNDTYTISRAVNGAFTALTPTATSPTIVPGDRLGLECLGTAIRGWKFSSGVWTQVLERTDAALSTAGSLAVAYGPLDTEVVQLDNFIGGTK